ncbi:MAG: DNA polymerase III subunit delta [Proteobacteria bacterium]|nr:DNA polymerase III subunit delta [Pseudomonadota bacterium]NIS67468.1 DNA polymerase III subunit delta [Pseudomonadota bacterium]
MNAFELEKELDREEIFPLYFLHGEETYLIDEARKRIQAICQVAKTKDFDHDLFLGGETPPERIIDAAKTLPMMAPWRVVVVKDAHLIGAQQVKAFLPYWENPSPKTCLIFLGEKLGPWKGSLKFLEKHGRVVHFVHPGSNLLTQYIIRGAKQLGKDLSPGAVEVMREMVGNHLSELHQELDKVASYVGDRKQIEVDDVETVVSRVKVHTIFDLTKAVGMKDSTEALRILNQMLESGEPPLRILTMIVRQFRLIWMAKDMRSHGIPDGKIGRTLGIPGFFLKGFLAQLKNFTPEELARGYSRLFEADLTLKSRSTSKRTLLEDLIISLCH